VKYNQHESRELLFYVTKEKEIFLPINTQHVILITVIEYPS